MTDDWWTQPRKITIIVDNDNWFLPWADELAIRVRDLGDTVVLARSHADVPDGDVAFYLACNHMTPPEVLARHRKNLVVHESDLPKGRGFAPMTWQILEGKNHIPICLLEMTEEADAGPVVYRDVFEFGGHEMNDDLRAAQGRATIDLCLRYLGEETLPNAVPQEGNASTYPRRRPEDSELDPDRSLAEQFDHLRTVDNDRYPAFFRHRDHTYRLRIERMEEPSKE